MPAGLRRHFHRPVHVVVHVVMVIVASMSHIAILSTMFDDIS
jgi:hypothetical protein